MKNIQQIRLENLELLVAEAGNVAELARRCGYDKAAYLYQLRAQAPKANGKVLQIGKHVANRLEVGMDKPEGWLSHDHSNESSGADCSNANSHKSQRVLLTVTAASGTQLVIPVLNALLHAGYHVALCYTDAARAALVEENDFRLPETFSEDHPKWCKKLGIKPEQLSLYNASDLAADVLKQAALDAVVICPASMSSVAEIVHGLAQTVPTRAAEIALQNHLPLVVVPHESSFSVLQLENLLKLAQLGVRIVPVAMTYDATAEHVLIQLSV